MTSSIAQALPFPTELAEKFSIRLNAADAAFVARLSEKHRATRSAVLRAAVNLGLAALREEIGEAGEQLEA